jgi:proteic killer suppression protein
MIISFKSKGLKELFERSHTSKIHKDYQKRCRIRLEALDSAERLEDLKLPGFDFHSLLGKPKRYSIHVNGPFCITFEWYDGDAGKVDFENYH